MKKRIILTLLVVSLLGCAGPARQIELAFTATPHVFQAQPTKAASVWNVYDPDPEHLWNRVFQQLYKRTATDGTEYGFDELDPLLWQDTTYLLEGSSYDRTIQLLDEFLSSQAENLIHDPLRRAVFQRDLWAVFDWLASQTQPYPVQRRALETRLVQIIRRVALSREEIRSLPDNYALAIDSRIFPSNPPADSPEVPFLPADLFQAESAWVPLGRQGGPGAMTHTESFPFFGRSAFLVFVRSSEGRAATLAFIESLNTESPPAISVGSQVALVRRMLLIDDQGEILHSPLVETIQIRHFGPTQSFHEFEMDRVHLFDRTDGGLVPKTNLFMLFMGGHGDVFESPDLPEERAPIPDICKSCHFHDLSFPNATSTHSIISYSRQPFPLPNNEKPVLFATTVMDESQIIIQWKYNHMTWKSLETLWSQASR